MPFLPPAGSRRRVAVAAGLLAATLCAVGTLPAQVWTGAGKDANWSTRENWRKGVGPGNDGIAVLLFQSDTAPRTSRLDGPYAVTSISLGEVGHTVTAGPGAVLAVTEIDNSTSEALTLQVPVNNEAASDPANNGLTLHSGLLRLASTENFINGNTQVAADPGAVLIVNGNIGGYGNVLIGSNTEDGGTLGGVGTVDRRTLIFATGNGKGGTLAPGDPAINGGIGTLTFNPGHNDSGNDALGIYQGGVKLEFQLGATDHDRVVVAGGKLSLPGSNTFRILDAGLKAPGDFDLIVYPTKDASVDLKDDTLELPAGYAGSLAVADLGDGRSAVRLHLTATSHPGTH